MWELIKIVIPKIKGHWKELAYCMRYSIGEVEVFDKEGKSNLQECCEKMFIKWLTTSHGPEPKTYETLLYHIKKIDSLIAESEAIEKELTKGKGKQLNNMIACNSIEVYYHFRMFYNKSK